MSVNGINSAYQQTTASYAKKENTKKEVEKTTTNATTTEESAVYEGSAEKAEKTYTISADNKAIIDQLKAGVFSA